MLWNLQKEVRKENLSGWSEKKDESSVKEWPQTFRTRSVKYMGVWEGSKAANNPKETRHKHQLHRLQQVNGGK
jgi:hypothetical protein